MNDYDWTQEDEQQAEARFEIWNEETQGGTVDLTDKEKKI